LRFIPKQDLGKEGYGDYLKLFTQGWTPLERARLWPRPQ
jgi:hypothetical protein